MYTLPESELRNRDNRTNSKQLLGLHQSEKRSDDLGFQSETVTQHDQWNWKVTYYMLATAPEALKTKRTVC